jgi:hypothetical protein
MNVEFLKSFYKDLDSINTKSVRQSLIRIIQLLEKSDNIINVPNTKNLKGFVD